MEPGFRSRSSSIDSNGSDNYYETEPRENPSASEGENPKNICLMRVSSPNLARGLIVLNNAIKNSSCDFAIKRLGIIALSIVSCLNSGIAVVDTIIRFAIFFFCSPLLFCLLSTSEKTKSVGKFALSTLKHLGMAALQIPGSFVDAFKMQLTKDYGTLPFSVKAFVGSEFKNC